MVAYWTTETGWNSVLQLRNNALIQDLTVTPVLHLADGAETSLASVTVKPQEVKSIDIATAISAVGAPNLVGTYGSVVLRYHSPSRENLFPMVMIHNIGPPSPSPDATSEGQVPSRGTALKAFGGCPRHCNRLSCSQT
jgi:hypothetical protein